MTAYRVLSLFSGIGGMDYAFQSAGFRIIEQVEIDDFCTQVLTKHWPAVPRHRDIFDYHGQPGSADVITAGFPCQPFSLAGKQRGRDDERFLWPQLYRVIDEVRPLVVFLENVPGLRTNDDGRTFKRILWELAEIGYDAEWGHLQAAHVGAPHKRERIFIVAYAASERRQNQPFGAVGKPLESPIPGAESRIGGGHTAAGTELARRIEGGIQTVMDDPARIRRDGGTDGPDARQAVGDDDPAQFTGASLADAKTPERERRGDARPGRTGFADDGSLAYAQQWRPGVRTPRQTRPAFRHRQRQHQAAQSRRHEQQPRPADSGAGTVESRVGRSAHGLSERLVGHRFPAPPGPFQYDFEAPRTAPHFAGRRDQLKALGNAVVPQVVYPVALAIREWLDARFPLPMFGEVPGVGS